MNKNFKLVFAAMFGLLLGVIAIHEYQNHKAFWREGVSAILPTKKDEWLPIWVGAEYGVGENGVDGCFVILVDKDTNQCDCMITWGAGFDCCKLADSLRRNGPPPPKKKTPQ